MSSLPPNNTSLIVYPSLAFLSQATGIESTMELVQGLRNELITTAIGWEAWSSLIFKEVGTLGLASSLPCVQGPTTFSSSFFTNKQRIIHDHEILTRQDMPFLFNILVCALKFNRSDSNAASMSKTPPMKPI
ncbi:hypothetical protein VP01_11g4 [Puccinia sorghi]|uniref:Uncharacterized protein n=1 Tax=Puccinia sorghi TaxID=27349 RepID=A0A0L6VQL0_9BASI|nr:hypothetical protein VP01_11g4 [Puccinia sorghi]